MEEWKNQSFTHRNPYIFEGLYLLGKREETNAFPGITLAFFCEPENDKTAPAK